MRPQSLNIVASPGASSNPSDFRATISRLWRLLVTRHSSTKRAAFRRHLQASRGPFDADLAPIRLFPLRGLFAFRRSLAHTLPSHFLGFEYFISPFVKRPLNAWRLRIRHWSPIVSLRVSQTSRAYPAALHPTFYALE